MHKILVIRLYFPLNALHVSDCISPSSGATLQAVHVLIVLKSGNLDLLEPSGPVQACNGIALPFTDVNLLATDFFF